MFKNVACLIKKTKNKDRRIVAVYSLSTYKLDNLENFRILKKMPSKLLKKIYNTFRQLTTFSERCVPQTHLFRLFQMFTASISIKSGFYKICFLFLSDKIKNCLGNKVCERCLS